MSESGATAGLASHNHDPDDEAPASFAERVRAAVAVPARLLGALFLPDRWLPPQVGAQRYGAALVAIIICGLLGAGAVALRLDVTSDVLAAAARPQGPPEGMAGGGEKTHEQPPTKSDRELQEEIAKSLATKRAGSLLSAGLLNPLLVMMIAVVVYLLLVFVGGTPTIGKTFTATAHAALPFAVKWLVLAGAALAQVSLTPAQAETLVGNPLQPLWAGLGPIGARYFSGVDPFLLWSIVIMGFGMAAAGQITRKRAFVTIAWVMLLYLALANLACGQPPEQGGPQGMPRR
jgi:hypothetical protein